MDFSYAPLPVAQALAPLILYANGVLSTDNLNVFFALREMSARREAAARAAGNWKAHFDPQEVAQITGLPRKRAFTAILDLQQAGLVRFAEDRIDFKPPAIAPDLLETAAGKGRSANRVIPFPRAMLRFLSRCRCFSRIAVLVGYLCRGLSLRNSVVKASGAVKIAWFINLFGLSKRTVQYARGYLIELGIISDDTNSYQRKLNKTGCYFTINCAWTLPPPLQMKSQEQGLPETLPTPPLATALREARYQIAIPASSSVDNRRTAPPPPPEARQIAPLKDRDLPTGIQNQKPARAVLVNSGVSGGSPRLINVKANDLQSFERVIALYRQAVTASLVSDSEQSLLRWVGAAVRAKSARNGDRVMIFMGIIRRGLWEHITQAQEDRARRAIRKYMFGSSRFSDVIERVKHPLGAPG